ncbi:uncharacterized protein LOC113277827 [Papaver somniferum]|uniref:uncharacterized protein LOC113277827 n=1 Tax=Papaver somniferum TaxID=3469 RepID=UPI000E704FCA|nr:uncharacterized protein LOC113277827 [Papaver somniferum]
MDEEGCKVIVSSSSSTKKRSERKSPPLPKAAPWLVFPYKAKGNKLNQVFYNICEPNNRTCRKFIPELSGKSYWQKHSHQGWLVVICHHPGYNYAPNWDFGDCFLLNPASLETIALPSLLPWCQDPDKYELLDCVLSSAPTTSTSTIDNADEPVVLFLYLHWGIDGDDSDRFLVFSHPGDEQWRTKSAYGSSLCVLKDKLYLMCIFGNYLEIDKGKLWDDNDDSIDLIPYEMTNDVYSLIRHDDHIDGRDFYVESSDELFKVIINYNRRQNMKVFNSVYVLRLDFSSKEWKVVTCLGDHVLFVGTNTRACCSASKMGLATGCLYYTLREDQALYKYEVQSSGNSVILPCLKLPNPWFRSDWIMILHERQQKEEKGVCLGKAVEKDLSLIVCEKNENKDGECEEISHWDILKAVLLRCLPRFSSYWMGKNEKDGGFEETSPWDILDADSKELVAQYLHPLDYVHFRSVSKAIRAMMPVTKPAFTKTSITKTIYLFPWLVFCRDNNDTVYNFVTPGHNSENYLIKFPELLLGAAICFQKGGWLLMSREEMLFFYNPFTRETINVPHVPGHYFYSSICFSSLPTSADCTVFAIDQSEGSTITVYSITRGKQVWDIFSFNNAIQYMPLCNPPILHRGAFYCVDYNGLLGAFKLEDNTWEVLGMPRDRYNDTYPYPSFLVESGDDLLLVKLGCQEKLVRIFKLNFPGMDWVAVESLGQHMLFISHTSCFSSIAPSSRMENKVYLPRLCFNGEGILFYSLETGRYDSFGGRHSSKNLCETEGWRTNCTWVESNWCKFTPQELNWLEPPF